MEEENFEKLRQLCKAEHPQVSDVIVWLQGDQFDRGPKVLELYNTGYAPLIFLPGNNVLVGAGTRPGENDVPLTALNDWLEQNGVSTSAILLDETCYNTADQAEHIVNMAAQKKWDRILLVTSLYHQPRAFLTLLHAMLTAGSTIKIINQPALELPEDWAAGGRTLTRQELWLMEQKKMKLYATQLADVQTGIHYLSSV